MKKLIYIVIFICCFQSCAEKSENSSNKEHIVEKEIEITDSIKIATENHPITSVNRDSINDFLSKPFDLFQFKEKKGISNSGGGRQEDFFFKPNKEGMYYRYFLFSKLQGYYGTNKDRIFKKEDGLEITVYKELGELQYSYIDSTEILIQVKATFNDFDLPELAFVGLDSSLIIKKFGKPDVYIKDCIIYQHDNNVLVLNIENKKVKWLKYIKVKEGVEAVKAENIVKI